MSRGRHRVARVRRPLVQPFLGVGVAATMLAAPLLLAAVPASTAVPAVPRPVALTERDAAGSSALAARDEAQASRGQARPTADPATTPEPVVEPPAPAPAAPEPSLPEPSVPVEPVPVAPPTVVGTLWVSAGVNVRSGPTADSDRISSLADRDQVEVTGTTENGWTQVVVDGLVGWVNSDYLSGTTPGAAPDPGAAALSDAACSIDPEIEPNLTRDAQAVYRAVCAAYGGPVTAFGGYRPGDGGDHGSGRAVDVMVSGQAGWEVARFLQTRAGELGISYLIYEQQYWPVGSPAAAWERMEDRGGATANHFDHVHVSVR